MELQTRHIDERFLKNVIIEYADVIDTVSPFAKGFTPIIPSAFDLVNAIEWMDSYSYVEYKKTEEGVNRIKNILMDMDIFHRQNNHLYNIPIRKVW